MEKWADYLISAVKTNSDQKIVDFFEVNSDLGNMVCQKQIISRHEVIDSIKKGFTYSTVFKTATGKWRKGDKVNLILIDGENYLKTNKKPDPQDQFDNVPEF